MEVIGEHKITKFAKSYAASRAPLAQFLTVVRAANWTQFPAVKSTFSATDYGGGKYIFNIGGNKYRLIAIINFARQTLSIEQVLTHEQYDRKEF